VCIEQPIGTGFSYGHGKGDLIGIPESGQKSYTVRFHSGCARPASKNPFGSLSLHSLSFVPEWGQTIIQNNAKVPHGSRVIPLNSVSMGNGLFGNDEQYLQYPYSTPYATVNLPLAIRPILSFLSLNVLWFRTPGRLTGRNMYGLSAFSEEMDAYDTYPTLARYLSLGPVQAVLGII
jgi:hypothetical protein